VTSKRIGLPGLGARLRDARKAAHMTQEGVARAVGVSWMTVHRWEHEQRTINENKLEQISDLYGKPVRWFLTIQEGDLDEPNEATEIARRIYHRVSNAPEKYHAMIEKVLDDMIAGLK